MSNLTFSVTGVANSLSKTTITTARDHTFIIDEPVELGGTNEAPNPVEYVLSALSSCLNIVAYIVAEEQGIEFTSLSTTTTGVIDPDNFLGKSTKSRPGFQEITSTITVKTTASEKRRAKWLKTIEQRCPIKDNLFGITPVDIALKVN